MKQALGLTLMAALYLIASQIDYADALTAEAMLKDRSVHLSHPLGPCDATMRVSVGGIVTHEECYRRKQ